MKIYFTFKLCENTKLNINILTLSIAFLYNLIRKNGFPVWIRHEDRLHGYIVRISIGDHAFDMWCNVTRSNDDHSS